jgi:hypothetical protein
MLLHNQRGASVSWEANGVVYEWAPYGACELPDAYVPLIKSEGFPVDVTPVPPKEKAERAAALATESDAAVEIESLRKAAATAEALAAEAKRAAEAADIRATAVREEADGAKERVRVLEEELRSLRADATEYESMIAAASAENAKLKEQLKLEHAKTAELSPKKK